jgi:hypothetical protein
MDTIEVGKEKTESLPPANIPYHMRNISSRVDGVHDPTKDPRRARLPSLTRHKHAGCAAHLRFLGVFRIHEPGPITREIRAQTCVVIIVFENWFSVEEGDGESLLAPTTEFCGSSAFHVGSSGLSLRYFNIVDAKGAMALLSLLLKLLCGVVGGVADNFNCFILTMPLYESVSFDPLDTPVILVRWGIGCKSMRLTSSVRDETKEKEKEGVQRENNEKKAH